MARWTDLARWVGPSPNRTDNGMVEVRGLVLHIAVGWFDGTRAWQRNPDSNVSSHFIVGRSKGELDQMVDTADRAWTQGDGNGRWLSSENEGFLASDGRNPGGWEKLSDWQVEANAQLLARGHLEHGYPLKVADHPGERGLGHHSMDREWLDEQWGHDACPGAAIVAQKPAIVARAIEIVGGDMDISDPLDVPSWVRENHPDLGATISVETALVSGYGHSRSAKDQVYRNADLLTALAAKVGGEDIDAALARHRKLVVPELVAALGPALADELREVPADRVEAAFAAVLARTSLAVAPPEQG